MQAAERLKSWMSEALAGELRVHLLVVAGAIGFMTFVQPFGTSVMSFGERLLYWGVCIPVGFVGGQVFDSWLRPILIRRNWRLIIPPVHILFITAFALTSVLVMEAVLREPIPLKYFSLLGGSVAVVSFVIWGIVVLSLGPGVSSAEAAPDPKYEAFRGTWPAELRSATLTALAAEDHYIRVYTTDGDALISGRFSDALEAVRQQSGTRVHRSWWVSGADIQRLDRKGGKWQLMVGDALAVPVSRQFRPEVRAQGWHDLG